MMSNLSLPYSNVACTGTLNSAFRTLSKNLVSKSLRFNSAFRTLSKNLV